MILHEINGFKVIEEKKQAGAELGQAQIRFGLVSIGMS